MESILANAGDAFGNRHARQAVAVRESRPANAGDAVRNRHARQAAAAKENKFVNAGDAVWDPHARQAATASESQTANAGDAGRNDIGSCHASRVLDELCSRFIQQSAIDRTKAAVVGSNVDIRQIRAESKKPSSNAGDAVGDCHARQTATVSESPIANTGDAVGDRHARQAAAGRESAITNRSYLNIIQPRGDIQFFCGTGILGDFCCSVRFHIIFYS